jgi:hypothetical protein
VVKRKNNKKRTRQKRKQTRRYRSEREEKGLHRNGACVEVDRSNYLFMQIL